MKQWLRSRWFFRSILMTLWGVIAAIPALADAPAAPVELSANVIVTPNAPQQVVLLQWYPAKEGAAPVGYRVYAAMPSSSGELQFKMITETEKTQAEVYGLAPGTYVFYVTAFNSVGESKESNWARVYLEEKPKEAIWFVTEPKREVELGGVYRYESQALAQGKELIEYLVQEAPLGAPIPYAAGIAADAKTGVVEWQPNAAGTYAAQLVARLVSDTTVFATQILIITVTAPPCATISGTVKNKAGEPVRQAWIVAVSADDNGPNWRVSHDGPVKNGEYELKVQEGTYVLYVKAELGPVWYPNAFDVGQAQRVAIKCGDAFVANFTVEAPPEPKYGLVAGRVTAKADGKPVMAVVQFMPRNSNGKPSDPNTPGTSAGYAARTDAEGFYNIELPDLTSYIAYASAMNGEYLPQYFDHVATPTEATPITIPHNGGAVNFALKSTPAYNTSLSGTVRDSAGNGIAGRVVAMQLDAGPNGGITTTEYARAANTEKDGTYRISNIRPGKYVLLAIPATRDFVPGYYVAGQVAARSWKEATIVGVGEIMPAVEYDITVQSRNGMKGYAKLEGYVKGTPGKIKATGGFAEVDAVPGTLVVAIDPNGNVSDYTFSDPTGWFQLNELAAAQYIIMADKVGYTSFVSTTELDYDKRSAVEMEVPMSKQTSSVEDGAAATEMSLSAYPNPTSGNVSVSFSAVAGSGELSIINTVGETMLAMPLNVVDGLNAVTLDASTLAEGLYFVRLNGGRLNETGAFVVMR